MHQAVFGRRLIAAAFTVLAGAAQIPEAWVSTPILPEPARRSQMYAFVNANIPPLARFQSVEEWKRYKTQTRAAIRRLLGIDDILAKHKPRFIHKGTMARDGYVIEKVNYESYPGMFVPAVVYVPQGLTSRAPAIISISGHSICDSKAYERVQTLNYNLVRRGLIVMAYDYFGAFERASSNPCKVEGSRDPQDDHYNGLFSYTARTATGIEVLDGIRAIDYLYSRPDVDRSRLAFTGPSGGGNSTYWVSAMDERVTLSIPVSSASSYDFWIKGDHVWDHHQRPPGLRALAEIGTLYAMAAPRPLLIVNGRPEMASLQFPPALDSYRYAREVYRLYGRENAIDIREADSLHGYTPDKRLHTYEWLERWFFAGKMPHGRPDLAFTPEPVESLVVGLPPDNLNIRQLYRRWLREAYTEAAIPRGADEARGFQAGRRGKLERLLNRRDPAKMPAVYLRPGYVLDKGGYRADRLQLEVAPDLMAPALFVRKPGRAKYKTILFAEKSRGTSPEANGLLERGYALLLFYPRGTGEAEWGGTRTANWALQVGRPPQGMWAEDFSKMATYALARPDVESVAAIGYGVFGKAALYAAALDPRIAAACVTTDTLSYRQEADSGLEQIFADVPGILAWGDTPQLAALVAPRPLAVLGAGVPESMRPPRSGYFLSMPRFTPSKDTVSDADLQRNYDWTARFYAVFAAGSRFRAGLQAQQRPAAVLQWIGTHY
jgi:dienelactone hydrolase